MTLAGELERRDYYGDLLLPYGASEAIVRQRFKRLARKFHPDVNPAPDAAERFRRIRTAYEVLTDPRRRALVDSWYAPTKTVFRRPRRVVAPGSPQARTRPASYVDNDRAWTFGCVGVLGFLAALLVGLAEQDGSLLRAVLFALVVGAGLGALATARSSSVREWLYWWLLWWP